MMGLFQLLFVKKFGLDDVLGTTSYLAMHKNTHSDFSSFELSSALLSAIEKVGYKKPTSIQADAIPAILAGDDVLASAETGSGKTTAFVLPLLQKIIEQKEEDGWITAKGRHVRALILVPTRELVVQVREEVKRLAQDIQPEVRCLSVYGGVKMESQMRAMKSGVDVLISTPNRLLDLTEEHALKFNKLQTLVIDEADRLVDTHFREEIEAVLKRLPNNHQKLLFTATFPESIRSLVRSFLTRPMIINIEQKLEAVIDQHVVTVNADKKYALLAHLLKENDWKQVLIFCSAKKTCDRVVEKLTEFDVGAVALHGNREQKERLSAFEAFKKGDLRVLVATDVASRGLDVESLDCVINFDLPRSPNDYTHRIGRTGRAGKSGQAISLISHHEYTHFAVIEKRMNLRLEREQVEGFEASKDAPPPPPRKNPKKKKKTKLSKKKLQKLRDKQKAKPYQARRIDPRAESVVENKVEEERVERGKPEVKKEVRSKAGDVEDSKSPWAQASVKTETISKVNDDIWQKKESSKVATKAKSKSAPEKPTKHAPTQRTSIKKVEKPELSDKSEKESNEATVNEHVWGKR